jgi:acyl carrier protein
MPQLSLDELREVMRACVGREEAVVLASDDLLRTFEELDFDSLAQVELAERLRDLYGIALTDQELDELSGPRDLLDYLNARSA